MFESGSAPESRVPASAGLLWSQRHNPVWLPVTTFVGAFTRAESDPSVWLSTDGLWTAELRRARRGDYVYLAIWRHGTLLGTYDQRRGWQAAGPGSTLRRKRAVARQLAFAS